MRISYSAIDTFQTCKLKYKYQYVDKLPAPKSKEAVFGTIVHATLKMLHEPSRLVPPTIDEVLGFFNNLWDSSVWQGPEEESAFLHQGIKILREYYGKNYPANFNIVDLESRFEAPLIGSNTLHQITGIIDRIDKLPDGHFEIIDYKTARKMPAQARIENNLQLSVYYLGLINRWPYLQKENLPVKVSIYFLKHGEKLSTFKTVPDLARTQDKILTVIEEIEKEKNFEPRLNPLCDWCGYQQICPLWKHKFKTHEPDGKTHEDIEKAAQEFLALKAQNEENISRLAELKEIINQYCDQHNIERLFFEQGIISRSTQKRFNYDMEKLAEILKPLGLWENILAVDKTKLKKTLASLPYELRKKIEEEAQTQSEFKTISISKAR